MSFLNKERAKYRLKENQTGMPLRDRDSQISDS